MCLNKTIYLFAMIYLHLYFRFRTNIIFTSALSADALRGDSDFVWRNVSNRLYKDNPMDFKFRKGRNKRSGSQLMDFIAKYNVYAVREIVDPQRQPEEAMFEYEDLPPLVDYNVVNVE